MIPVTFLSGKKGILIIIPKLVHFLPPVRQSVCMYPLRGQGQIVFFLVNPSPPKPLDIASSIDHMVKRIQGTTFDYDPKVKVKHHFFFLYFNLTIRHLLTVHKLVSHDQSVSYSVSNQSLSPFSLSTEHST